MEIKVFGLGCSKCKVLESQVRRAIEQLQVDCLVTKGDTVQEIMSYGIMSTPALAIDGVVKIVGRVASVDEIKHLILDNPKR